MEDGILSRQSGSDHHSANDHADMDLVLERNRTQRLPRLRMEQSKR